MSAYSDAVAADAPSNWWRLGEATGSLFAVDAADALELNYTNVVGGFDGIDTTNKSTRFQPTSKAQSPGNNDIIPTVHSVEFWAFPIDVASTQVFFQNKVFVAGATFGAQLALVGGLWQYAVGTGVADTGIASVFAATANLWHHIVGTNNGATQRLYVDGAQVASVANAGVIGPIPAVVVIGFGAAQNNFPVNALMDELAVYPSALSAARVSAHFAAADGKALTPTVDAGASFAQSEAILALLNQILAAVKRAY